MRSEKISSKELFNAIDQIYQEKGITKEYLIDALKTALKAAYKRDFENTHNNNENGDPENHINVIVPEDVDVDITETSIKVYAVKEVCEEVAPEEVGIKITLEDAKKISKKAKIGDSIKAEVTPKNFGRIAASTGKNILVQKIIEAEKNLVYTQYADKVGQIIVGTVQKTEKFGVIVDLGRV